MDSDTDKQDEVSISCSLGAMQLDIRAHGHEEAQELFENIWKERLREKQEAESVERRQLEQQEPWR